MASSSLSCTICVDNFENSGDICSTVCGHVFHSSCLQQWQERSNTCPLCNQSNPQPHRLFLDLPTSAASTVENGDCNENIIIIKGFQPDGTSAPLSAAVLNIAKIMRVSIRHSDIKNISKKGNTLHVAFYATRHKDMFMENKFRLKINRPELAIHEVMDEDTKNLFRHAHKLKQFGYNIIFVKDKKIYAKKCQQDPPLNICSKEHVDSLCVKPRNSRPNKGGSTAANPTTRNTVTSFRTREYRNATAPPLEHMDSDSAALIRQIIMEDIIEVDSLPLDATPYDREIHIHREINAPNIQNRNRMVVSLPLGDSHLERENNLPRYENRSNNRPQNKSFKNSIMSLFRKITSNFK